MSDQPVIASNKPERVELVKGRKYFFCACGRSANQPFCDGSHQGTPFSPIAFEARKDGPAFLCACKQSARKPYCDGTHQNIGDQQVGQSPQPE